MAYLKWALINFGIAGVFHHVWKDSAEWVPNFILGIIFLVLGVAEYVEDVWGDDL